MCDLETKDFSLKCIWVKKLLDPNFTAWWKTRVMALLPTNQSWLWECNLHNKHVIYFCLSRIWADIWSAWSRFNYRHFTKIYKQQEILDQVIWFNSNITDKKGIPFHSPRLENARCVYI